jgi:hypothetical protein
VLFRSPQTQDEIIMTITASQVKDIKTEFAKLRPAKITLNGNRSFTVKEAVFALAPTLERMKKRGFNSQELAEKLRDKGIEINSAKWCGPCSFSIWRGPCKRHAECESLPS